jgi:hypothetical protein
MCLIDFSASWSGKNLHAEIGRTQQQSAQNVDEDVKEEVIIFGFVTTSLKSRYNTSGCLILCAHHNHDSHVSHQDQACDVSSCDKEHILSRSPRSFSCTAVVWVDSGKPGTQ